MRENVELVSAMTSDVNNYARDYQPYKNGSLYLRNYTSLQENAGEYPFYIHPKGGTEFRAEHMIGGVRQLYPFVGWQQDDFTLVLSMRWCELASASLVLASLQPSARNCATAEVRKMNAATE